MRLILLGAPGVGKGTQATLLSKALSIPHISTGDMFRYHISNNTDLGMEAKQYIDKGMLVPDEITVGMVADRLKQQDCRNGFVLDGFPRTIQQAKFLDKILKDLNIQLDMVINITLDDREIIKRLSGRRICPQCSAVYHIEDKPPKNEGLCDNCGTGLVQRGDDKEETIIKRLQVYHSQSEPILEYYKDKVKIVNIESHKLLEVTTKRVFEALGVDYKTLNAC
ncbi:adenylate kinase [Caldicoprobacter guelmensis]|uniref:adenylate kinase n=1 Tax=Caldicoprobacter guelmensis TaxID=1170224 RepID=UPI00195C117F|nr:adenylate kinase [Caldicoprobacter guelmensis]MBM7581868.1 adenylate kinase [Caldicoprobacter guelmensis]